jgi:hypothetical protein
MQKDTTTSDEIVTTLRPEGKRGIKISRHIYIEIATLLFQLIEKDEEVSLVMLIRTIEDQLKKYPEIVQLCYHVKLDLEVRGYLRIAPSMLNSSIKVLRLTNKAMQARKRYISLTDTL